MFHFIMLEILQKATKALQKLLSSVAQFPKFYFADPKKNRSFRYQFTDRYCLQAEKAPEMLCKH